MTTIRVANLSKSYGNVPVLQGVDLEIAEGSLTAVLGRSGSGKTTLLRTLAGFERPDGGEITIDGEVVAGPGVFVAPERRRIGFVPQEGALFPHLSVAANIGFGLDREQKRGNRVKEILALIGLEHFGDRYPHELSGGQQQRVALGRALAPGPRLVLLDEPFSSLDAKMRTELRADVATVLRESGTTALLVTHDQDEALSLADHVAVLRHGHVGQFGTPREVYASPVDADIASFVGVANFVTGVRKDNLVATPLGDLSVKGSLPKGEEGSEVLVLIRPEELQVDFSPGEHGGALEVRVVRVDYFGHDALLRLAVDEAASHAVSAVFDRDDDELSKESASAILVARWSEAQVVEIGATGHVSCENAVVAFGNVR